MTHAHDNVPPDHPPAGLPVLPWRRALVVDPCSSRRLPEVVDDLDDQLRRSVSRAASDVATSEENVFPEHQLILTTKVWREV